jgi:hypothetical protein
LRKAEVAVTGACFTEKWTRFMLSNVPTTATFDEISREVEMLYPEIRLGRSPRWLTTAEHRVGKDASSVVLTVVGQQTTKSIGRSQVFLFNRRCSLKEYVMFGPSTRGGKCQLYGHPTPRCTAPFPACAVCAEPHLTKHHPCDIPSCKKGPACTHPPIICVSCRGPHKAFDPKCPTHVALTTRSGKGKEVEVNMTEE